MTLEKINRVYFLGIGGVGMSALARFFLLQNKQVFGYDLASSEITKQLTEEGAYIHFEEDVSKIPPQVDMAIYTPAISKEHIEYLYFVNNNIPLLKRSEVLGMICCNYPAIAIAGTHGKTTTTAMVTQMLMNKGEKEKGRKGEKEKGETNLTVLRSYGLAVLSFIGGISKNLNSNFLCQPDFDTVIVEADEFDRSFLTLHPKVAVITSMDADHLDVYKNHELLMESFQLFADQIEPDGALVIYEEIARLIEHPHKVTYGFSDNADYQITNIQFYPTKTTFDLTLKPPRLASQATSPKLEGESLTPQLLTPHSSFLIPVTINIPGRHNALNAVAALAACVEFLKWKIGDAVDIGLLQTALAEFAGVKRRFDIRVNSDEFVYIDDYAHHPQEIKAFLEAVKKSFPAKKITGVFQPHLFSRTKDFTRKFADELEVLDEIILLDIYPAREEPIEGITSNMLLSLIKNKNKALLTKESLVSCLQHSKPEVLLTMGAGDIDKLVNVIESLYH